MEKYDTSQLTEFPRFESDSNQSGVSTFFNKLWKFPIFSPSEAETPENKGTESENREKKLEDVIKEEYDVIKTETGSYATEYEGRSLPNVLRRISSLVALGSGRRQSECETGDCSQAQAGTRYADTELARYWMPDDISRECYDCDARFGTLRRRHHCRVCGQIFCSRCCSQRVPGQIFGCAGGLRVCNYCCNVVLSYLRENDMTGDIPPDLRTLQENLQAKFPDNKAQVHKGDFMFAQEERSELRACPKEALHDIFRQLSYSLPTQHHRYRLVRYTNVWRGCDIMQWLMENTTNKTRACAAAVCGQLLGGGYMESVCEPPHFADYALYRPRLSLPVMPHVPHVPDVPDVTPDTEATQTAPEYNRLVESVSSYCLDLNLGNNSARLTKATKTEPKSSPGSEEEHPILDNNEGPEEEAGRGGRGGRGSRAVEESGEEHLRLLLRQCLARRLLPPAWLPALLPLCRAAAQHTALDMMNSDMDIRNYVQVKKVPGGSIQDSCLINGVVITKNVAHRGMPQQITNPTVLLLDCSIAYQRVEGKLTSLEPMLLQEQEYLVRCAARIGALRPRVVLVRGAAARGLVTALLESGVALAVGVRERALRRAARCARADLVASIDARIGMPRLGTCSSFRVVNYSSKTLMILEGCAEPNLGCCILLRGASLPELVRVKKVVKFMLLACYHWKLEKAFLADIEATLPEPGTFDDDSEITDVEPKTTSDDFKDKAVETKDKTFDEKTDSELNDTADSIFNTKCDDTKTNNANKSVDDSPMKSKPLVRKTDSDKNMSCGVPIRDFSDPLQSTLSVDDEVFLPKEEAELKADSHYERWSTDDVVLSMSPNTAVPAPPAGLRLARAPRAPHTPHTPRAARRQLSRPPPPTELAQELHPFVKRPISAPADDPALRASLAHYRAAGCSLLSDTHKQECPRYRPSVVKRSEPEPECKESKEDEVLDPLAPENHQRLSVLLYSYCAKSPNVPDFCANPWIVNMEMYGRNDISLGAFLHKYCFSGDHRCPANNCPVPMNHHVRRFVHGDVCITITCNTVGHSNVDKPKEEPNKHVMFWSRCESCGRVWRGGRVRASALSQSLCGYLVWRVRARKYVRPPCPHPLHMHSHAFVNNLTTACFRYNKITTYDIQLPPDVIAINYDPKQMRDALISQLNELMLKGHETFSGLPEGEAEREHAAFRHHVEGIHLALTDKSHPAPASLAVIVRSLWNVYDNIITGEKMVREAQDKWSSPPAKPKPPPEATAAEEKSDAEEVSGDSTNDSAESILNNSKDEKDHTGAEEDEEKGDKKTVKQILAQLLSNNQPSNQSGMIICGGLLPVAVNAGETGSLIAAALVSHAYLRARALALHAGSQNEQDEGEVSATAGKEKTEGDKTKVAKSNADHIEVMLKEGLVCRVYYARQFHRLRHMLLAGLEPRAPPAPPAPPAPLVTPAPPGTPAPPAPPEPRCCLDRDNKGVCDIEEGFVRSLAHCVPWAARGGKSGSTFCKTKDDRYVLKEMTKPEWQQFLEFAPHYFNHVTTCRQKKLPSLLARILGVFSVGGAGSGVLVLENVWYGRPRATRFDLKGASRQRLATPQPAPPAPTAPPAPPTAAAHAPATASASTSAPPPVPDVLLDENLLRLRWETQLYISSSTGSQLWAALERDTQFLAALGVMDYSLLLAIDGTTLVLGIIDYIRTFTWDKKLEHLVKKNLGSGQPTVVSPDQYQRRFRAAARKYFLHCPHHWDRLALGLQPDA